MPGTEPGAPAPDRDQRHVDGADLGHPGEEVGVAREVDGRRAFDDVADGVRGHPEGAPTTVVLGSNDADREGTDRERLADLDLEDDLEPPLAEQASETARDDNGELRAEPLERREVEVVVVRVGDEDGIETAKRFRVHRDDTAQMDDPIAEERIGDQPDTVEVDDDRRVADVLDGRHE